MHPVTPPKDRRAGIRGVCHDGAGFGSARDAVHPDTTGHRATRYFANHHRHERHLAPHVPVFQVLRGAGSSGEAVTVALLLLPSCLLLALPFAMVSVVDGIRRHKLPNHVERATALRVGLTACIFVLAFGGWIVPAANQQFRVTVFAGRQHQPLPRGCASSRPSNYWWHRSARRPPKPPAGRRSATGVEQPHFDTAPPGAVSVATMARVGLPLRPLVLSAPGLWRRSRYCTATRAMRVSDRLAEDVWSCRAGAGAWVPFVHLPQSVFFDTGTRARGKSGKRDEAPPHRGRMGCGAAMRERVFEPLSQDWHREWIRRAWRSACPAARARIRWAGGADGLDVWRRVMRDPRVHRASARGSIVLVKDRRSCPVDVPLRPSHLGFSTDHVQEVLPPSKCACRSTSCRPVLLLGADLALAADR